MNHHSRIIKLPSKRDSRTNREVAERIRSALTELASAADEAQFKTLAFLLRMAELEAKSTFER
jgi:hypothetical protein